jgi:hypothetical protein
MNEPNPIPRVNLNGSARRSLIEQRRKVCDALNDALQALGEAAPHGRDYQTAAAGSYELARALYEKRHSQLSDMRADIMNEAIAIQSQ